MKQLKVLSAVGLLAVAGIAQAEVTSTVAVVSDYDYRGITQTGEKAALQVSIDYAHDSGWYAGVWGSNVDDFCDTAGGCYDLAGDQIANTASTEIDLYTGFKGSVGDFGWDAGLVYYTYAGASDLNFAEIYGKVSYKIVSGGIYFSNDFGGKAYGGSSDSAIYVTADVAIPAGPLTIGLHTGYSTGDGIETAYFGTEDAYFDYSVGVSYSASNFTTSIKWVAFDADVVSDDRIILSVSTALPWE